MAKASTSTAKKTTTTTKATTKKATTKATKKKVTAKARTATKARPAAKTATKASTKAAPKATTTAAAQKTATKPSPAKKATAKTTTKKAAPKTAATKKATSAKKTAAKAAPKSKTAAPKKTTKAAAAKSATRKSAATDTSKTQNTDNKAPASNIVKKDSLKSALKAAAAKQRLAREKAQPQVEGEKPKIAPAPMRPALRVAKRAEARRDKNQSFKVKTQIIYPAHGVGYITEIEKQEIAGISVELFVINFEHEKMKLRVPTTKAATAGMRNLSSDEQLDEALKLIEGKARIKRTMWSRRAQEYEAKINSGDLTSVAEVVRDLFRAADQPEQSYSERQLFEQARERLGRELAAKRGKSLEDAIAEIHKHLDLKEKVPS